MATVPDTQFETVRGSFAGIGIRQFGDPVLQEQALPLDLPREQILASAVLDWLHQTMKAARKLHKFSRGLGLSAPQIGISLRVAIIHPHGQDHPLRMVNPRVIGTSSETDISFEGCLSFFDYRGEVRRPVAVTVEYQDARGAVRRRNLSGDVARLALHEIDHLDGRLYTDLMEPGAALVEADGRYP